MKHLAQILFLLAAAIGATRPAAAQVKEKGDTFQLGDKVLLMVEGDTTLSDTFTVVAGPALRLPVIGDIALAGVTRSGVEPYLREQLQRYLKHPVVHAHALIRLAIVGDVARPGFYAVPADLVLSDVLMAAGGPSKDAKVDKLRIQREDAELWSGNKLQAAIARGATVDQLGLRAGDRIVVPGKGLDTGQKAQILGVLVTIPVAIYGITRIVH